MLPQRLVRALVRQAHRPTGVVGHLEGWLFAHRPSNVARNRWAVDLLDPDPTDAVLELGCGPGVAISAFASRVSNGLVVGVDHSGVMISQARRRNAAAVRAGRVRLVEAAADDLQAVGGPFDAALAVNTIGMWRDPATTLREIRRVLHPGGTMAAVSQPRCPGADAATSDRAAEELIELLRAAGFVDQRVEVLDLDPPAVCVLGTAPRAD